MLQALPKKQFDMRGVDGESQETIFSNKQKRLLIETLHSSWTPPQNEENELSVIIPRPFLAEANVGIFYSIYHPPLAPDVFLSLDVQAGKGTLTNKWSSYLLWEVGKAPEVVIRIVTNEDDDELRRVLRQYERLPLTYSVIFDPLRKISEIVLRVYEIAPGKQYQLRDDFNLPTLGLSLTLWEGHYEGVTDTWLRWCDQGGELIPTGAERAARAEAEVARLRDELERLRTLPQN